MSTRIKAKDGKWAGKLAKWGPDKDTFEHCPWIWVHEVECWAEAVKIAPPVKGVEEIQQAIDLVSALPQRELQASFLLNDQMLSQAQAMATEDAKNRRAIYEDHQKNGSRFFSALFSGASGTMESIYDDCLVDAKQRLCKPNVMAYAYPSPTWSSREAEAAMMDPAEAALVKRQSLAAKSLSAVLGNVRELMLAAGIDPFERLDQVGRSMFSALKLDGSCAKLSLGSLEEFDSSEAFTSKRAIAVFVDDGHRKGFLDKSGKPKMDLAEACLFATEGQAKRFAVSKGAPDALAAEVEVSALSFKVLVGNPPPSEDANRATAGREAREMRAALESAQLDELREEIKRREALDAQQGKQATPSRRL